MNELVVPPAPHWYKSSMVACAPDNTLVYGSKNDVVVIREKKSGEPADVRVIHGAHTKQVTSVSLNRKWKDPHSYVASLGEENVIKIWDLDTFEKKTSNKDHVEHKEAVIGAVFAGDDRVVSATCSGRIGIWNINANESKIVKDLFKNKVTLTCLSSCPHAGWLLAFGLSSGAVVVADLRRNGHVLYQLRGHYQSVVSLSWCPAPINVFPQGINNTVKNKSLEDSATAILETKTNNIESSDEKPEKKINPWANLVHADDVEEGPQEEFHNFLKECDDLKNKILGLDAEKNDENKATVSQDDSSEQTVNKRKKEAHVEERQEAFQNRPLPVIFDGDFLDDSGLDSGTTTERSEDLPEEKEKSEAESTKENANIDGQDKTDLQEISEDTLSEETEVEVERQEKTDLQEKNGDILGDKTEAEGELKPDTETSGEDSGIVNDASSKSDETIEEDPRTEYLLVSSGKDKSVYIWRAGTDGRMQTSFQASRKGNHRRERHGGTWITVCWVAPDTILTSSATGDILAWTVPKPKDGKKLYTVVHYEHSSTVFNIVTPPKHMTAYNWRDKVDLSMWSWGQDGKLINYDLKEEKIRYSYFTVTAMVTCVGSSVLDPNRLAIGLRDGGIRIWDLSVPHSNVVTMQKYQPKVTQRVSAIAWHPIKEMILGFGTEEGRVGFIDLVSRKNTLFPHYFHNQVYRVEWGPVKGDTDNLGLYVVAEGKMAIYNIDKPTEDPTQLELPEKLFVYKFAWKPDYSLLLLNGKDGSLVVLKTDLTAITTMYPNDKGLNSIVWHPDAFTNKTEISPRCNWFAATTSKGVMVLDCRSLEENDNFADKVVVSFEGHLKPTISLAWCPFEGKKIVSTAADGLSHVWDVTTKSIVATFIDSYLSHNYAIAWSPVDPDLIILGDKMLTIWSISHNPPKNDEEFISERKRLLAKSAKTEPEKVDKNKIKIEIPKPKSVPKNFIVPSIYVSNDENISKQVDAMRKLMNSDGDNSSETKELDPFHLFGSKEQVSTLLDANYRCHQKEGKFKSCELISLWKGNMAEHIQNAINENRVTPSVIALAPMVSLKLWQDCCVTYAKKLSEEANADPLETAMYFLACHKVEDAIHSLCLNLMFREALALAKHRLPENSDITTNVVEKWAQHSNNTGNFENAAYCYISINDYEKAAKALARRNRIEFLEFALELAEKAGNKGLCDSIKFKCNEAQKESTDAGNEGPESNIPSRGEAVLNNVVKSADKSGTSSSIEIDSQSENGDEEIAGVAVQKEE